MRKKYLIIASSIHIGNNICIKYGLNNMECEFITKSNYLHNIFSLPDGLIVYREFSDSTNYKKSNKEVVLDKNLKNRIFSIFELLRKRSLKNHLRKLKKEENLAKLKFNFIKKENLKDGDKVFFRQKEIPNNMGYVKTINNELFINNIPLEMFDEIILGNIRVVNNSIDERYYKLEEKEAFNIYSEIINHKEKEINKVIKLLVV